MPSPTRVYRGVPAAKRQADRRRRLMAAALDLMGSEGWSATSVRAVCQRAGLSTRFFYESFPDLDELAVAVFDEELEKVTARVLSAVAAATAAAPQDTRSQMEAGVRTLVVELTDDPRLARLAFVEALGSEPLMRRRLDTMRTYSEIIAGQARAVYGEPPAGGAMFVELTASVLAGGMAETLIRWLDGGLPMSREELIDDCVELFVAMCESAVDVAQRRGR